jgi:hypothetical protein
MWKGWAEGGYPISKQASVSTPDHYEMLQDPVKRMERLRTYFALGEQVFKI